MRCWWLLGLVGCGRIGFDPLGDATRGSDAFEFAPCNEPWSQPFLIGPGLGSFPSQGANELELYVSNADDMIRATRATRTGSFSNPTLLSMPPNTQFPDTEPSISIDGLELFFTVSATGNAHTYHSLRTSTTAAWGLPEEVGLFSDVDLSSDRLSLYSSDLNMPILMFQRAAIGEPFGAPTFFGGAVNEPNSTNQLPSISTDELDLYFQSNRDGMGGTGPDRPWDAHRANRSEDFSTAVLVDIPNFGTGLEISADDHFLYYTGLDGNIWAISRCE